MILRPARAARRLAAAYANGKLHLAYQPQVHLGTGEVVGVEALLRWTGHSPAEFIPVAEASGMIIPIGKWVTYEALRQLKEWDGVEGMPRLHMSVNASARQFRDSYVSYVEKVLERRRLSPERLTVELTESTLVSAGANTADLYELNLLGPYVSLDDFGTGFSSLAYLRQLPVEVLKIDRLFVSGSESSTLDYPVVCTVMSLGLAMGLHVVAEGVETAEQACELAEVGCEVGQGFFFGPALAPEEIPPLARRGFDASWCAEHPLSPPERRQLVLAEPSPPARPPPWRVRRTEMESDELR